VPHLPAISFAYIDLCRSPAVSFPRAVAFHSFCPAGAHALSLVLPPLLVVATVNAKCTMHVIIVRASTLAMDSLRLAECIWRLALDARQLRWAKALHQVQRNISKPHAAPGNSEPPWQRRSHAASCACCNCFGQMQSVARDIPSSRVVHIKLQLSRLHHPCRGGTQ
jgi:hypothetical protein